MRLEELTAETDPANAGSDITESVATLESTSTAARNETIRLQAARNDESRARNADIGRRKSCGVPCVMPSSGSTKSATIWPGRKSASPNLNGRANAPSDGSRGSGGWPAGRAHCIPKAHEPAIVAALGERLAAWLVTDGDSLWRAVANSRSGNDGSESRLALVALDAQFRPDSRPNIAGESGVIGWADERVEADDAVAPLVGRLLGNILLVKDAPSAYRLAAGWPPGYTAAAPERQVVDGGGLVEVGAAAGDGIRETRRRDETTRLAEMRAALAKHEADLVKQQEEIDALQEQVDERANEERRLLRLENEAGQTLNETRRQLENLRQQRDFVARRQNERATARAQAETRIAQAEMTITSQNERLARSEAALTEARDRLAALPTGEAEQQQQSLRQSLAAAQTILAGRQAVVDSRRATLNQSEGQ